MEFTETILQLWARALDQMGKTLSGKYSMRETIWVWKSL